MKGANQPDTKPDWELFDLKTDPREMNNLYRDPSKAKLVETLKRELDALQRKYGDTPISQS